MKDELLPPKYNLIIQDNEKRCSLRVWGGSLYYNVRTRNSSSYKCLPYCS